MRGGDEETIVEPACVLILFRVISIKIADHAGEHFCFSFYSLSDDLLLHMS